MSNTYCNWPAGHLRRVVTVADVERAVEEVKKLGQAPPGEFVVSRDVADLIADMSPPSGIRPRHVLPEVRIHVLASLPPGFCLPVPR